MMASINSIQPQSVQYNLNFNYLFSPKGIRFSDLFRIKKKPILAQLCVLSCLFVLAQNVSAQVFNPFSENTTALYTTWPEIGPTSSLAFTAVEEMGEDSIFHPVKTFVDNYESLVEPVEYDQDCEYDFWGTAGQCYRLDVSLWFGSEMRKTNSGIYEYTTSLGDILVFDYSIDTGDSSLVFENENMQLYLVYELADTATYLGVLDSVAQYRFTHTNPQGDVIADGLHDAPIVIGKELGTIHFMRIDSFPQILQPIVIAGHMGAEAGLYEIKSTDFHAYEIGDVFQHNYNSNLADPFTTVSYYETRTVLSRSETETEITYTFDVNRFNLLGTLDTTFVETLLILEQQVIAEIPFELQLSNPGGGANGYKFRNLLLHDDDCGSAYTYSSAGSFFNPCMLNDEACYGWDQHVSQGEWYGLPESFTVSQGRGYIQTFSGWEIVSGASGSETTELIYSNKNGVSCGSLVVITGTDRTEQEIGFHIFPNPAWQTVNIELIQGIINMMHIYDIRGRLLLSQNASDSRSQLDISGLPDGLYLLQVVSQDGVSGSRKLVVQR